MSGGTVICTEKGDGITMHVIEGADGFAVVARCGRKEGSIATISDKAGARRVARSVVACADELPGFRQWLADGGAGPMDDAF